MTEINYLQHNIRFIRTYLNKSQEEFGNMIGANADRVWTYEKRSTEPDMLVMEQLEQISGLSVAELRSIKLTTQVYKKLLADRVAADEENELTLKEDPVLFGKEQPFVTQLFQQQNKLLESLNRQSDTSNQILKRMADHVEARVSTIDTNLNDLLGRVDILYLDLSSSRDVALRSLARLEGLKNQNELLREADSIKIAALGESKKQGRKGGKNS